MQTLNFECLTCELTIIQESFALLWKMTTNRSLHEIPRSGEDGGVLRNPPDQVGDFQKAPEQLQTALPNSQKLSKIQTLNRQFAVLVTVTLTGCIRELLPAAEVHTLELRAPGAAGSPG